MYNSTLPAIPASPQYGVLLGTIDDEYYATPEVDGRDASSVTVNVGRDTKTHTQLFRGWQQQ